MKRYGIGDIALKTYNETGKTIFRIYGTEYTIEKINGKNIVTERQIAGPWKGEVKKFEVEEVVLMGPMEE